MPTVKYPPLTIADAVDYLRANMSLNYEIPLTTMKKEDLGDLHFSLGAYVRNVLGLWSGNEELLESCRSLSGNKEMDTDAASMLIIEILWEILNDKDNLGLTDGQTT